MARSFYRLDCRTDFLLAGPGEPQDLHRAHWKEAEDGAVSLRRHVYGRRRMMEISQEKQEITQCILVNHLSLLTRKLENTSKSRKNEISC